MFGHANQVGQRVCLGFFHYVGAVSFHGKFAHAKLVSDLLIEKASHNQVKHFLFARCKRFESPTKFVDFLAFFTECTIAGDCLLNCIEQILAANRLRQKLVGTLFHRARTWECPRVR